MSEVIVTLTSLEKKPGSNDQGAYTLWLFKGIDRDGQEKKFQTFVDDIGRRAESLMQQPVRLEFHTQQRPYTDRNGVGRVANNNVIDAVSPAGDAPTPAGGGSLDSLMPIVEADLGASLRIQAYGHALKTLEMGLVSFEDTPSFTDVTALADAIVSYAKGQLATADESVAAEAVTD